jgi:hypothetical protein
LTGPAFAPEFCGRIVREAIPHDPVEARMRRQTFRPTADDDSVPVMVPRNDKALVPTSPERVRQLRKHLVRTLRDLQKMPDPGRNASALRPEPEGFTGRVARTACTLCAGFCCRNGADDAFLDDRTMARVRAARPALDARATMRLYVERVPTAGYEKSCIFHSKQGCTLDRSLRSDVCNAWFCEGLHVYLANEGAVTPTVIIAGEGDGMRVSPVLTP